MVCSSNPELQALGPTGPWLYCSFPCCVNTPAVSLRAGQLWTLWPLGWIFQGASASSQPPHGIWLDDSTIYCPFPVSLLRLWPLSSKLLISRVSFLGKPRETRWIKSCLFLCLQPHSTRFTGSAWPTWAHAHRAVLDPCGICLLNQLMQGCVWLPRLSLFAFLPPIRRWTARSHEFFILFLCFHF